MEIKYIFYLWFAVNFIMAIKMGLDITSKEIKKRNDTFWTIGLIGQFLVVFIGYFYIGVKILSLVRWDSIFYKVTL